MARSVALGGRGVLWLFYLPVLVIGMYTLNAVIDTVGHTVGLTLGEWDLVWFAVITCLWYFVIGRVPNARMVRNVRGQVLHPCIVYGVSLRSSVRGSGNPIAVFNGASANVLVTSSAGIQLWGGSGDGARPVKSFTWSEVEFSEPVKTRALSARIPLRVDGSADELAAVLFSAPGLSTLRLRGRARARAVGLLQSVRPGAAAPQHG